MWYTLSNEWFWSQGRIPYDSTFFSIANMGKPKEKQTKEQLNAKATVHYVRL